MQLWKEVNWIVCAQTWKGYCESVALIYHYIYTEYACIKFIQIHFGEKKKKKSKMYVLCSVLAAVTISWVCVYLSLKDNGFIR